MLDSHKLTALLPFGCCLLLAVACGGKDDGDNKNTGGSQAMSSGGTSGKGGSGSSTGGSSSNPGGELVTSIPKDKPLGSLSDAESAQLCEDLKDYISTSGFQTSVQEMTCRASGVLGAIGVAPETDAEARAGCKTAYDECMAAPLEQSESCDKPEASCMATVNDYEACMGKMTEYLADVNELFPSCAELTIADFGTIAVGPPATPAACEALETKCPSGPSVIPGEAP